MPEQVTRPTPKKKRASKKALTKRREEGRQRDQAQPKGRAMVERVQVLKQVHRHGISYKAMGLMKLVLYAGVGVAPWLTTTSLDHQSREIQNGVATPCPRAPRPSPSTPL
ncbi:hypothetical protein Cadr_000022248 [Camelus dromedarius]|uniref:Uncharacterized protein n=1 Tax=Camelus dromedarius TaxID=9838 RepID=A0A5N4CT08_CAMDR|nr:hypothetical protein Cadr_000022248 [Camelus dromedarius]